MELSELRKAIDDADEIILRAIAARMEGVRQIAQVKQQRKMPIEDTKREDELKKRWKKRSTELGIAPELALLILDFLLTESKSIQSE